MNTRFRKASCLWSSSILLLLACCLCSSLLEAQEPLVPLPTEAGANLGYILPSTAMRLRASEVSELRLRGWSNEDYDLLGRFDLLTSLDVQYCLNLSGDGLRRICKCKGLRSLSLACTGGGSLDAQDVKHLLALTELTFLNLSGQSGLNDESVAALAGLTKLEHLVLDWIPQVSIDGLRSVLPRPLRTLSMRGCRTLDDAVTRELVKCTTLAILHIDSTQVSSVGVYRLLAGLPNLAVFGARRCPLIATKGSEDYVPLLHCRVRSLDLSWCGTIDTRLQAVVYGLSHIEAIDISGCENVAADPFLTFVGRRSGLRILKVSSCPLGREVWDRCKFGSALQVVDVSYSNASNVIVTELATSSASSVIEFNMAGCEGISDHGVDALTKCVKLRVLDVSGTGLSGASAIHLSNLTLLNRIVVSGKWSQAEIDILAKRLPDCVVEEG